MPKELLQSRVDSDIINAVEDLAEDRGLTRSEAHRRCVQAGLRQHGYEIMMADGNPGTEVADQLEALEATHQQHYSQLRRDTHILLSGVAVAVGGVLIAAAGIAPTITFLAVLIGMVTLGFTVGYTVLRRLIVE